MRKMSIQEAIKYLRKVAVKGMVDLDNIPDITSTLSTAPKQLESKHTLDSTNTYRLMKTIREAIEQRDFSKRVDPWYSKRGTGNKYTWDLEELLKYRAEQGSPFLNMGYAKVIAGIQTYGQYLASSEGLVVRQNTRIVTLVQSLIAHDRTKVKYPRRCTGKFNLAYLLKYALDINKEAFVNLSLLNLAWLHNAIHFVINMPIYSELSIQQKEIDILAFVTTILWLFYTTKRTPEEFLYALFRNPNLKQHGITKVNLQSKLAWMPRLTGFVDEILMNYDLEKDRDFHLFLVKTKKTFRNLKVTNLSELLSKY